MYWQKRYRADQTWDDSMEKRHVLNHEFSHLRSQPYVLTVCDDLFGL